VALSIRRYFHGVGSRQLTPFGNDEFVIFMPPVAFINIFCREARLAVRATDDDGNDY